MIDQWEGLLVKLGRAVRDRISLARRGRADLATAVAHQGGDTIFAVDRHVEPVIEQHVADWPDVVKPLELIAEGLGEHGRRRIESSRNDPGEPLKHRVIIDPIDGTRNIMYDKRSAWFLAAVAPAFRADGTPTRLADCTVSAMVELPTSKQAIGYAFAVQLGDPAGLRAFSEELHTNNVRALNGVGPSAATTLKHGFAQVVNFFPGTKVLASELMERIVQQTVGAAGNEPGAAAVFDDQYMTTGGQMVELLLGHDRFTADLRPLFYRVLEKQRGAHFRGRGLECHPYDAAGMLVAQAAGVIITDGLGRPLDAPMDVHAPVHWCGYANQSLRDQIEPVIKAFFAERGVTE